MIARQHNLTNSNKPSEKVYVFEVPDCFFNGVQVCLLVKDVKDIPRAKYMVPKFKEWVAHVQSRTSTGVITPGMN